MKPQIQLNYFSPYRRIVYPAKYDNVQYYPLICIHLLKD